MRIGFFSDSFLPVVDGVGRVVHSYVETLGSMGHAVYAFAPRTDFKNPSGSHFQIVNYNTVRMPGRMPYRVGVPQLDIHFEKQVRNIDLDIIHLHSPFMLGFSGLRLAKKRGIPAVATFHSKYYDDFMQVLKVDTLARMGIRQVVEFYRQCDEVWAVNEATGHTLGEYGFRGKVIPMPNGTEIRALDESVLPSLRKKYALKPDEPMLLFVGQLNWKKNIRRTLEALQLLAKEGVPFKLLLVGQGAHREEIEAASEAMGLFDRVVFTGHIQNTRELDGLYALAKLLVFPSLYDNAPMVLREAAVMGTPAVLIRGSNAAEGVTDGINGLTCLDNAESLADAIRKGISDEAFRQAIGKAAQNTIPVPWTAIVERALCRYQDLIDVKKTEIAQKPIRGSGQIRGRRRKRSQDLLP